MTNEVERAAIALYDRFTHTGMDRRAFMAELTRSTRSRSGGQLAGHVACHAPPRRKSPDDARIRTQDSMGGAAGGALRA